MPEALKELESQLDKLFGSGSQYQLSHNAKRSLARAAWWIALVLGVIQLWTAWTLWNLGHVANTVVNYANYLSATYGNGMVVQQHLGFFYYLSVMVLLVNAVVLLLAVSGLKASKKQGWNWLYYSLLINVVYGVVRVFSNVGGGIGQLIFQLIGSAIVAYFLFQVRRQFTGEKSTTAGHGA